MELLRRIATLNVPSMLGLCRSVCNAVFRSRIRETARSETAPSRNLRAPPQTLRREASCDCRPHIEKSSNRAAGPSRELDFNLETITGGWQDALDRAMAGSARRVARHRAHRLRDESAAHRSEVAEAWKKSSPRSMPIKSDKAARPRTRRRSAA